MFTADMLQSFNRQRTIARSGLISLKNDRKLLTVNPELQRCLDVGTALGKRHDRRNRSTPPCRRGIATQRPGGYIPPVPESS